MSRRFYECSVCEIDDVLGVGHPPLVCVGPGDWSPLVCVESEDWVLVKKDFLVDATSFWNFGYVDHPGEPGEHYEDYDRLYTAIAGKSS